MLGRGEIHLPAWLIFGVAVVHIFDDADDQRISSADCDGLTDRVLAGEKETSGSLVKNEDVSTFEIVVPGKVASPKSHAHGAEVAGSNHVDERVWEIGGAI